MKFKILVSILFFLAVGINTYANPQISITPTVGKLSTNFKIIVSVDGNYDVSTPVIEDKGDFEVNYIGPQQQISVINGNIQKKTSFVYQAKPKSSGILKAPIFSVKIENEIKKTQSLTVKINQSGHDTTKTEDNLIKIETYTNKSTIFAGEQFILTNRLLTQVRLEGVQMPNPSSFDYWSEKIDTDQQYQSENETGDAITVLENNYSIYPLINEGVLKIEPMIFTAQAQIPNQANSFDPFSNFGGSFFSNNFFNNMFSFGLTPVTLSTNLISINVIALPKNNIKTDNYSINYPSVLVGETSWQIKSGSDQKITLTVSSYGNINNLKNLQLPAPDNYKFILLNENITKESTDQGLLGTITLDYQIIPLKNEYDKTLVIKPFNITYFHPYQGNYKQLFTEEITVNLPPNLTPLNQENLTTSSDNQTIRNIKQQDSWISISNIIVIFLVLALMITATYFVFPTALTKPKNDFTLPKIDSLDSYQKIFNLINDIQQKYGQFNYQNLKKSDKLSIDILYESNLALHLALIKTFLFL